MELCSLLWTLLIAIGIALILVMVDLKRRGYSKELTWGELLKLYSLFSLSTIKQYKMHKKFERDVRNFEQTQNKFLMDRKRRSENTAFGRDNHFSSIRSVNDFRRNVPIFDYAKMEDYVKRAADGEKSALLGDGDDICVFVKSSGTSGGHKLIPVSKQSVKDTQDQVLSGPLQWFLRSYFPWNLKRFMSVNNCRSLEHTKGGYALSAISNVMLEWVDTLTAALYTTPLIGHKVENEIESHYIHALFGLCDKHIALLRTVWVFNFIIMMRRMKLNLKDLLNDMRRGRIKEDLNIPANVRDELNKHLKPMPERAAEVEREFAKGMDKIVPRLWPEFKAISGVWSGGRDDVYYKEALEMIGPDIVIISAVYMASEGLIGASVDNLFGTPRYTLIPDIMFYEFLPIINDQIPDIEDIDCKELLLGHELELNKTYEIIITNSSGFFRYRIGDVIKVVGFYQQAPQIEFVCRSSQSLNVAGERISEGVFSRTLHTAAKRWPAALKEYTVAGSQYGPRSEKLNLGYILFIQLEGESLTEQQTDLVEEILREQSDRYDSFRKLQKLDKMTVYQVIPGTFERFRTHLLETTAVAANQFKMPRVLKSAEKVAWFMKNVRK